MSYKTFDWQVDCFEFIAIARCVGVFAGLEPSWFQRLIPEED
jgi:hypothetical protein